MIPGILLFALIVFGIVYNSRSKSKKLAALKLYYEQSLKGSDKRIALNVGRAYYSALREGKILTMYDEQAITNDLSTMKESPEPTVL